MLLLSLPQSKSPPSRKLAHILSGITAEWPLLSWAKISLVKIQILSQFNSAPPNPLLKCQNLIRFLMSRLRDQTPLRPKLCSITIFRDLVFKKMAIPWRWTQLSLNHLLLTSRRLKVPTSRLSTLTTRYFHKFSRWCNSYRTTDKLQISRLLLKKNKLTSKSTTSLLKRKQKLTRTSWITP